MARPDQLPGIRPRPSMGRQLDVAARHSFPAISTVLLMLLTQIPVGVADQSTLLPAVTLPCIYFWSLYRPAAMPPPVIFVIGVLFDLLGYLPLGVGTLSLLGIHGFVLRWRGALTRRGFLSVWLAYSGFAIAASALIWVLTIALTFHLLSPAPAIFQAALATALYPALAILFIRAHRSVADPERA